MELYPDIMNPVAGKSAAEAIWTIDSYLRYIKERTQLGFNRLERYVSEAGVSDVSLLVQIDQLRNETTAYIGTLSGNIQSLTAALNNAAPIIGTEAPTSSTEGSLGQNYCYGGRVWVCKNITGGTYTWAEIGG